MTDENTVISEPKSMMASAAEKTPTKTDPSTSTENVYKKAWRTVYDTLPLWRQKELDAAIVDGKLEDNRWNDDFVQRVVAVAEQ